MKRKVIILLTIISVSFAITSCDDFLVTTPTDFLNPAIYYNTPEQLDAGLNSVYATLSSYPLFGDKMQSELALQADEGFNYNAVPMGNVRHYNVSSSDKDILAFWKALYAGIDKANFLLENINKPVMEDVDRGYLKSEALFLRAYFYFLLVQNFGEIPLRTESAKSVNEGYDPRSPVRATYNQIWTDLIEAEKIAQPIDQIGHGGRVSKSAIQGILARVALYMAGHPLQDATKWVDARKWSNEVIKSNLHELNASYEQVFINYAKDIYDYKESILEVEFWGNNEPPYANAGKVAMNVGGPLYNKLSSPTYGVSYGWIYSTDWLYKSYPEGDIRRDRNIANFTFSTSTGLPVSRGTITAYGRAARKWDRKDEPASIRMLITGTSQNFPILRYSDVLLMFAEANNELSGDVSQTLDAINQVRRRGMGLDPKTPDATIDLTDALSQEDLRAAIRAERPRELCYEALRKGDVVRWGLFYERMQFANTEMQSTSWGTNVRRAYFENATPRDTLWPIPDYERGLNPNLTQNSGW